ncbi:hypothetical protein KBY65_00885 [Cyanobium sp. Alchichica 3B3-8F6]|uniref:hypothetical protein n=1 Tax=Cyanobium sp. Alchichica 3B3-8F6 TaxID=2823696 RepID=UPI0020CD9D6E|nr:hypothetical protein [Cyanobium sp. Alchichica 3B3-8F6]MCP9881037.1 hypothetical protein [Cyanobium sp. Alchichica 3B3-8F6]
MSTSWEPLPSTYRSKQAFLASLPPWRRLLQKLNWHPTVELKVQRYELEQRMRQMRKEDERLKKEDERLDELSSKLSAILSSSDTSSTPRNAMPGESEM